MDNKKYNMPNPLLDPKEEASLAILQDRYNEMITPSKAHMAVEKVKDAIPEAVKIFGNNIKLSVKELKFYDQMMDVVANGFSVVEKQASKVTISDKALIKKVNNTLSDNDISSVEEICLARSYDLSKISSTIKTEDVAMAFAEGGATGWFGFAGLPFNLVLSMFLYYRAVQTVALTYGYDVKHDASELIIASDVFMNALAPNEDATNEVSSIIGKVMAMTTTTGIKQAVTKTWAEMASEGGIYLLIVQIRALANKSAQKALEKAGEKGLEKTIFSGILKQVGKGLSKKALSRAVPAVGAIIGALFDVSMMSKIVDYADVFYNKRFILEKEARINALQSPIDNGSILEIVERLDD